MKHYLLLTTLLFLARLVIAQTPFQSAYSTYQNVPDGLLESIAWNNTRMIHLSGDQVGCSGIPQAYGIMGLHNDGKAYFNENGNLVAQLSGISIAEQKLSVYNQVMAYACAFNQIITSQGGLSQKSQKAKAIRYTLNALSEIPDSGAVNLLARDMQVYSILTFMNSKDMATKYDFKKSNFNLIDLFGAANYKVLTAEKIVFNSSGIESDQGDVYIASNQKSNQYTPAIWNPAPICNFSSRQGVAVSAITIHTVQGTYAGAISWAQNCASSVSYHYVIRSSDGQVTQMVLEEDKGWHVGSENPYTIGYEHEGYVDNAAWYTEEMYNSSADLSRDIVNSGYGIPPLRTYYGVSTTGTNLLGGCTKIKGHQHYPNQTHTDPGINWNWEKYYQLINNSYTYNTLTTSFGSLYDTGGPSSNYQDDEREFWLIQPVNAQTITLDFTVFDIESGYDNLYIYDGDSINDPLIGIYSGTSSPGSITASSGSLLLEFRSDCGTTSNGWEASYTSTALDNTPPNTSINAIPNWLTADFTIGFTDLDSESGIAERYYNVSQKSAVATSAQSNGAFGFVREHFEDNLNNWTPVTGDFSVISSTYSQTDTLEQNASSYALIDQQSTNAYLYEWKQVINPNNTNQRAGMHFFCDDPLLPNRGNSYFVYIRGSGNVQIYSVDNDIYNLEIDVPYPIVMPQDYKIQTSYDPSNGWIKVYIDGEFVTSWQDPTPIQSGNSISLRSGGCLVFFDDIHVYKTRSAQANISVGPLGEFSEQSINAIESGFIKSIVIDSADNISQSDEGVYLVDYSPAITNILSDGNGNDIDTFSVNTIEANWSVVDIHSDIAGYEVAIGTALGIDDVYPWTTNGLSSAFSTILTNPIIDQIYYISIRTTNGAGIVNESFTDGQRYVNNLNTQKLSGLDEIILYPNPTTDQFVVSNIKGTFNVIIYDMQGKICIQQSLMGSNPLYVSDLRKGNYQVLIQQNNSFVVKNIVIL